MDIGTGKDLNEYVINNKSINYHLIDILDPMKDYSVYDFQKDFYEAYNDIQSKNKIPILCGGTGLYVESTLLKYDLSSKPPPNKELRIKLDKLDKKELLNQINLITTPKDRQNLLLETRKQIIRNIEVIKSEAHDSGFKLQPMNDSALVFGVQVETEQLRKKIKQRLIERIDEGMINEVEELVDNGLPLQRLDYFGLEYKFIGKFLRSELTKDEFISGLTTSIRKFAKRQRTWFRRMEKRGVKINWIEPNNYAKLKNIVAEYIDES